ncbi:MAG: hypothetical protein CMJ46_04395 [Planctomyces sp.]|nr:hypothetical protein [Planctomyces sp.]
MARIDLFRFDWSAFEEFLVNKPDELAAGICDAIRKDAGPLQKMLKTGELSESKIRSLFTARDWYSRKGREQQELMDALIDALFTNKVKALASLKLEYLATISFFTLYQATQCEYGIDPDPEYPYLYHLGNYPLRYPGQDRMGEEIEGYSHGYSLYSPDIVEELFEECDEVREYVEQQGDGELHDEFMFNLFEPVQAAAQRGDAIFAWSDT